MKNLCVQGNRIFRDQEFSPGWFLVEQGKISDWGYEGAATPENAIVLDTGDRSVIPGLVDLHLHGFAGIDCSEANENSLRKLARSLAAAGTTSFLATLYPAKPETLARQLRAISRAGILGAHLEGPFVNPQRCGALDVAYLLKPNRAVLNRLLKAGGSSLRRMTIAPELPGALPLIRQLCDAGVAVSMGHSQASYEQAQSGMQAGARSVTHLFNAMPGLHHREPGLAGFALFHPEISCELIGDCHHIAPSILQWVFENHPNAFLISDGLKGTGLKKTQFAAGGSQHVIRHGASYLKGTKTLSGSCTNLLDIVRKLVANRVLSLEEAILRASTLPARECGVAGIKGSIEIGADADFLVLGKNLKLEKVFLKGKPLSRR